MPTLILQYSTELTPTERASLPTVDCLQTCINAIFQQVSYCSLLPSDTPLELCLRIVGESESARLNAQYRQQSGATNVLSFPNEPNPELEDYSLGDIAICAALVQRETQALAIPLKHHWLHLTTHGVLHLLGYDHIQQADAYVMETLEISILQSLGVSNPYDCP